MSKDEIIKVLSKWTKERPNYVNTMENNKAMKCVEEAIELLNNQDEICFLCPHCGKELSMTFTAEE